MKIKLEKQLRVSREKTLNLLSENYNDRIELPKVSTLLDGHEKVFFCSGRDNIHLYFIILIYEYLSQSVYPQNPQTKEN